MEQTLDEKADRVLETLSYSLDRMKYYDEPINLETLEKHYREIEETLFDACLQASKAEEEIEDEKDRCEDLEIECDKLKDKISELELELNKSEAA